MKIHVENSGKRRIFSWPGAGILLTFFLVAAVVKAEPGATVQSVASGQYHSCALLTDGSVQCWGRNTEGQIGDGTTLERHTPVIVSGINTVIAVSVGYDHSCALLADRTVKCWGYNISGQLGDGSNTNSPVPVAVSGINNAIAISAGTLHSCALLSDNTIKCWGNNDYGQLGDNTQSESTLPVHVSGITNATAIRTGYFHSCALLSDGSAKCWGRNFEGQIGDGTSTERHTPVAVSGISNAIAITTGYYHTCALLENGLVDCWGNNSSGQVGDNTTTNRNVPVSVIIISETPSPTPSPSINPTRTPTPTPPITPSPTLSPTPTASPTITPTPTPTPFISPTPTFSPTSTPIPTLTPTPTPYPTLTPTPPPFEFSALATTPFPISGAIAIVAGGEHTCAILSNNTIKCWGRNFEGQLGDGTNTDRLTAVSVSGINNAITLSAGERHNCAVLTFGTVKCWGYNGFGQLGDDTTVNRSVPTPITIDTFPPSVFIFSPTGSISAHSVPIDVSISDNESGVQSYFYSVDNVVVPSDNDLLNMNDYGPGMHTFSVTASDTAGHSVTASTTFTYSPLQISSGTISGRIYHDNNASENILEGAIIQLCHESGDCFNFTSDASGEYVGSELPVGQYEITVFPPDGSSLLQVTGNPITLTATESISGLDYILIGPMLPPPGTTISNNSSGDDNPSNTIPVVNWGSPLYLTTQGCIGGNASYGISINNTIIRSGNMPESPSGSGTYSATIEPLFPNHGDSHVDISIVCSESTTNIPFDIYIDPSGTVKDENGNPIVGADVSLYRISEATGQFELVPNDSAMMSLENRRNPDVTDNAGHFSWNVVAGYYKVRASKEGCASMENPQQNFTESRILTIPPPVTNLELTLRCNAIAPTQLKSLAPAKIWIGLKNSDDVGTRFDLKAEVYKDGIAVASGELDGFAGGSSGFNNAHVATIPFGNFTPVDFPNGSQLQLKLSVRNACTVPSHNSGTARLWYNDSAADSKFDVTIGSTASSYYLRDLFVLAPTVGLGPKKTVDVQAGAKCSAFKPFGTWTLTQQAISSQLAGPPTDKNQCKNDGWKIFNNPVFKNQGDCVSYTNHH